MVCLGGVGRVSMAGLGGFRYGSSRFEMDGPGIPELSVSWSWDLRVGMVKECCQDMICSPIV